MNKYNYGTGRRKTSVARVFIKPGKGEIIVNDKKYDEYFNRELHRRSVLRPLEVVNTLDKIDAYITVKGGGITGQADAIKLGLARALIEFNSSYRKALKAEGLVTRDSRMVERKKYGKPKARKSSQYSKR
jgi:small subunit ribosomal protein S9